MGSKQLLIEIRKLLDDFSARLFIIFNGKNSEPRKTLLEKLLAICESWRSKSVPYPIDFQPPSPPRRKTPLSTQSDALSASSSVPVFSSARASPVALATAEAATSSSATESKEVDWDEAQKAFYRVTQISYEGLVKTEDFQKAVRGEISDKALTLETLPYFLLALIVGRHNCLEGLSPIQILTVFRIIQDIIENPLEMYWVRGGLPPTAENTRAAYNTFLLKGRADTQAGAPLWQVFINAFDQEAAFLKRTDPSALEALKNLFLSQSKRSYYPIVGELQLKLLHFVFFSLGTECHAILTALTEDREPRHREQLSENLLAQLTGTDLNQGAPDPSPAFTKNEVVQTMIAPSTEKIIPYLQAFQIFLTAFVHHQQAVTPAKQGPSSVLADASPSRGESPSVQSTFRLADVAGINTAQRSAAYVFALAAERSALEGQPLPSLGVEAATSSASSSSSTPLFRQVARDTLRRAAETSEQQQQIPTALIATTERILTLLERLLASAEAEEAHTNKQRERPRRMSL